MSDWVLANKCPQCGGRMMLDEFYIYSVGRRIRLDGRASPKGKRSGDSESYGAFNVHCENCENTWEDNEVRITPDVICVYWPEDDK